MPRDLGGVSPTCSSDNRQRENLPQTFPEQLGKKLECWLGQIPTEEREFVNPSLQSRDSSTPLEQTSKMSWDSAERERETSNAASSPQGDTAEDRAILWWPLHRGKESSVWVPGYPSCAGCFRMNPFLSRNTQSTEVGPPPLEVGRILRKRKIRISKGIQVIWFLLTSPTNIWEDLSQGSTH